MSSLLALDTSVAVRLLVASHPEHGSSARWWAGRPVVLSGHAAAETYSVLTRLPGDARVTPADAARLMTDRFGATITLSADRVRAAPTLFAEIGVWGGAVYDGLVGLAAADNDAELATCDARARSTYEAVGARVVLVPSG